MTEEDVRVAEKAAVYSGYFRIDQYRFKHRLFSGDWSAEIVREVFERGHAAAVLPYDPERDAIVLIEQFRIGAYAANRPPWLLEVVAGIVEPGETVESVARREIEEEAGRTVTDLIPITQFLVSPGGTSQTTSLFCGRVDSEGVGGIHGLIEEHEDIRVMSLSFDRALAMLEGDRIVDAATIIALQWLALHRAELRGTWC